MTEFDDLFLEGGGLAELQKAMEDPGVARAIAEARIRTGLKNLDPEEYTDEYPITDENTEELDSLVEYLIGTHVRIDGAVTMKNENGEYRIIGDDISAEFRGFIADVENGKLEYKYYFQIGVLEDPEGTYRALTTDEVLGRTDEDLLDGNASIELVAAQFDSVHLSFNILHPVQALAWLSFEYPEAVKQLDDLILGSGADSAEKQLMNLKHFSVVLPVDTPTSHVDMALQCLREYVFTLIAPDIDVGYGVVTDGDVEKLIDDGECETMVHKKKTSMFSLLSIITQALPVSTEFKQAKPAKEYSFALHGMLHSLDADVTSEQVIIPLHSLEDMKSLRGLYLTTLSTGEKA